MFFSCKGKRWTRWRQHVEKLLMSVALFVTFAAIYQAWAYRDSTSLWFSLSLVSTQPASVLGSESPRFERPNPVILSPRANSSPPLKNDLTLRIPHNQQPKTALVPALVTSQDFDDQRNNANVQNSSSYTPMRRKDGSDCVEPVNSNGNVGMQNKFFPSYSEHNNSPIADMDSRSFTPAVFLPERVEKEIYQEGNDSLMANSSSHSIERTEAMPAEKTGNLIYRNGTSPLKSAPQKNFLDSNNVQSPADLTPGNVIDDGKKCKSKISLATHNLTDELPNSHTTAPGANLQVNMPTVNDSKLFDDYKMSRDGVPLSAVNALETLTDRRNTSLPLPVLKKAGCFAELEQGLRAAKKAIINALPVNDTDLYPPLYHNVSSFKKLASILELLC
eukprot:c19156_g1_i1 orf=1137-2303(-)